MGADAGDAADSVAGMEEVDIFGALSGLPPDPKSDPMYSVHCTRGVILPYIPMSTWGAGVKLVRPTVSSERPPRSSRAKSLYR